MLKMPNLLPKKLWPQSFFNLEEQNFNTKDAFLGFGNSASANEIFIEKWHCTLKFAIRFVHSVTQDRLHAKFELSGFNIVEAIKDGSQKSEKPAFFSSWSLGKPFYLSF